MKRLTIVTAACLALVCPAAWADTTTPGSPGGMLLAQAAPQRAQVPPPPTPEQRVGMLKQWLQMSQNQIRSYEWVETTAITQGGDEKIRRQNQCYYGTDGKVAKVRLSQTAEAAGGPPGILPFGRIAKKVAAEKKEEATDYMKSAVALMHSYIPPDPARIQAAANAGKFSLTVVQPGRLVRLDFRDYLKPGDVLGIEVELPTNRLAKFTVASYVDQPDDAVSLAVNMSVLPDGTMYAANSVLDANSKGIRVAIDNTGYRKR